MYMPWRRGLGVKRFREVGALSSLGMLILIVIGLIALAEAEPPQLYIFKGASPFNNGAIGTMEFVNMIRSRYPNTLAIASLENLKNIPKSYRCLYIVISPETMYRVDESRYIVDTLLSKCNTLSFLIADENITSNNILLTLNSSIYIQGETIYSETYGFYPPTYIDLQQLGQGNDARIYRVVLDVASPIAIMGGRAMVIGRTVDGYSIASYEKLFVGNRNISVIVIGDGSIFLNQVMKSNISEYKSLAISLVNILCSYDDTCNIIIDGSHYQIINPLEFVYRAASPTGDIASIAIYQDPITIVLTSILRIIHPSTWLTHVIESINSFFSYIRNSFFYSLITSLLLVMIIYRALSGTEIIIRDERLPETREIEMFVFRDLRESIAKGKYKLTKHDFINLFEIVNNVFRSIVGIELCSDTAITYISRFIETKQAKRYVDKMCKGYRKAVKGGIRPFILSWHRFTMAMLRESEGILSSMGYALTKEKGVEYVLLR